MDHQQSLEQHLKKAGVAGKAPQKTAQVVTR